MAPFKPLPLLTWLEEAMRRTEAELATATEAHLESLFDERPDVAAAREVSRLAGRYACLAEVAGAVRSGKFDRRRSE